MVYKFYSKYNKDKEAIDTTVAFSRLQAAKMFAFRKKLTLKEFLNIYYIPKTTK